MKKERKNHQLRFAPLIRVSTDGQEKKGVSLQNQKDDNLRAVEALRGVIPDHCWEYVGSEHATPDQEREMFNSMLAGCSEDLFDAVIFANIDRWSRSTEDNDRAINILRKAGKRVFLLKREFVLTDHRDVKDLKSGVLDGEAHAARMLTDAIWAKVRIAKRGFPINGEHVVPFGRKLLNYRDRARAGVEAEWEIISKDQKFAMNAADRYIEGERLKVISEETGMPLTNLREMLTKFAGPKWEHSFVKEEFGIDEHFETDVPELLPADMRKAIEERIEKNTTFDRDYSNNAYFKNRYLLKGFVFCGYCGKVFYGTTNPDGHHYYYHNKSRCGRIDSVKGVRLEIPILAEVASLFSDWERAEAAIKRCAPDQKERNRLRAELKTINREVSKLDRKKKNILDAVEDGFSFGDGLKERAAKVEQDLKNASVRIQQINIRLNQMPDIDSKYSKIALQTMQKIIRSSFRGRGRLLEMSFDDKRQMLENAFTGRDEEGEKYGVYLKTGYKPKDYIYELKWKYEFDEIGSVMVPERFILEKLAMDKTEYLQLFNQLQTKNRLFGKEKTGV